MSSSVPNSNSKENEPNSSVLEVFSQVNNRKDLDKDFILEGGTRIKNGQFKSVGPEECLVTIVTVVYNGEKYIEETILSVINQSYTNVEYIIVDGGSTDGTLGLIRKYEDRIDYWVSEGDYGIYDAMNKGIALSSGAWVNFMNAGDVFLHTEVINEVFSQHNYSGSDFVYGNHVVVYPSGRERFAISGDIKSLWKGSQFCHQAVFSKSQYVKKNMFDINCGLVADFKMFYKAQRSGAVFSHVDSTVCRYQAGGVSDLKRIDVLVGFWNIVDKKFKTNIYYLFRILLELIKERVKG